jgi:probable rRNA maturation factor
LAKQRKELATLLQSCGIPDAELSILFTGDRAMRSLNRRYRGIDRTTDVLSFSQREGQFADIRSDILGDIVISVPAAVRQARELNHSLSYEIERLLVHGLLHLLGYDHERSPAEARKMRRREAVLFRRIAR